MTPLPSAAPTLAPPTIGDQYNTTDQNLFDDESEISSSGAAAAAIQKPEETFTQQEQQPTISTATQVTQIAAPVIGVFGGIALIAAAMFYVVRKRKRNSKLNDEELSSSTDYDNYDDSKHLEREMQDISLSDDDEAITAMDQPPKLAPYTATTNTTTTTTTTSSSSSNHTSSTTEMSRHYCSNINSSMAMVPENHPANSPANMTDYNDEELSSCYNPLNPPPLSHKSNSSCRSSATSTVYTDALTNPISSAATDALMSPIAYNFADSLTSPGASGFSDVLMSPVSSVFAGSHHVPSILMIAERQQLHHQMPNILNHCASYQNNDVKPSLANTTHNIETYKAQLTNLAAINDEDENDTTEQEKAKAAHTTTTAITLPYVAVDSAF
ncbi:hypothetical protein [Parasitella parasitica]|uniref:Uncharacterized protein n=1 Tax=Parasitella parasitica TaxID=35722 RepID=A0A0B7NT90_9FUNG|nr:hypothetical protein [Parasitella parasitica]